MRIGSVRVVAVEAWSALRRFPETLVVSLASGAVIVWLVHQGREVEGREAMRFVATLSLGIPVSFAFAAALERAGARLGRVVAAIGLALLLAAHFAVTRDDPEAVYTMRLLHVSLAAHLLVAFLPYAREAAGCWEWNARLFTRFALALVFSGIVYLGLVASIATAQGLLGVPVAAQTYMDLYVAVAFGFNTWFFLAGVPQPLPAADDPASPPRELRVLVTFVLIPLVSIYLVILYLYVGRIVVLREWPRGTIGYIVSAFSIVGLLTLLLGHPMRRDAQAWFSRYARAFGAALVPLVVLLVLGAWRRVSDYGLTESRYLLLALGGWIGIVGTWLAFSRRLDVRMIPMTLFAATVLTAAGPWGAYAVSWRSQLGRLEGLIAAHQLSTVGEGAAEADVGFEDRKQISSILDYLNDVHAGAGLQRWFDRTLVADVPQQAASRRPSRQGNNPSVAMMQSLGLAYVRGSDEGARVEAFSFGSEWRQTTGPMLDVSGFSAITRVRLQRYGPPPWRLSSVPWKGRAVEIGFGPGTAELQIVDRGERISIDLAPMVADLRRTFGNQPPNDVEFPVLYGGAGALHASVYLRSITGRMEQHGPNVQSVSGDVLLRFDD
jgi:hypothetical protein